MNEQQQRNISMRNKQHQNHGEIIYGLELPKLRNATRKVPISNKRKN